jgi:hypothetical protein
MKEQPAMPSNPDRPALGAIRWDAWNEYDEGGWLAPTLGRDGQPDTARLAALCRISPQ